MRAGTLNRRVRIEKRVSGQDEAGQPVDEWTPVTPILPANIKGQTGMGTITRNQENVAASINAFSVRIRFREDVDDSMRLVELRAGQPVGKPFSIRQVRPNYDGRQWTDLVCEQGGSDG